MSTLAPYYLYIKAFHIIAMVAWFAALFYLPRLFVYHTQTDDQIGKDRFCIMERRLLKAIMTPAMIVTWVLGLTLLWLNPAVAKMGWIHAKILLVIILSGYHGFCAVHVKKFAADANQKSEKYFRWFNEVPTVILIAVVVLAVAKPF